MKKHNDFQTRLIHAPRKAPQFIETVQPPYFAHQLLFSNQLRTFLIVTGLISMTIAMEHMALLPHSP